MSIMIDMPPAVVEKAEAYAQERGTTLSRMFGDYVASLEIRSSRRDWRKIPVSSRVRRLVGIIPDEHPEMSYSEMISEAVAEQVLRRTFRVRERGRQTPSWTCCRSRLRPIVC